MASVRATATHTYSLDDCLGVGATCQVYKGISKNGDIRALKVFEPRAHNDITREVAALRKLDHPNVIKYYGCEEEIGSRRVVVITEFCDGGSLFDSINKPEYAFGLDEEEFLLFLKHILAGMKHYRERGFIHRDIKPANILRCIADDGSSLYKLSDFGTAKPLDENEYFQSLVGTEEYLHPDIFRAAFMDRSEDRHFSQAVDLWSLGATLYHCATGRVPFKPHTGRADKNTMYAMIAKKPSGVIGGTQTKHMGEIHWVHELPATSALSPVLKKHVKNIILALMETDTTKMWTFESFFSAAEDILKKEVVVVLTPSIVQNPFQRLYLNASQSLGDVRKEIEAQTGISVCDQVLIVEDMILQDQPKDTTMVQSLPPTSLEEPIILLPTRDKKKPPQQLDPVLSEIEERSGRFPDSVRMDLDHRHAKLLLEQIALVLRQSHITSLAQRHYIGVRRRLRRKQSDKEDDVRKRHRNMSDMFADIQLVANSLFSRKGTSLWPANMAQQMNTILETLESCAESLGERYTVSNDVSLEDHAWCFEDNTCEKKLTRWKERARDIVSHFLERRRKKTSSRLTEKIHALEKSEILQIHQKAREHWSNHCMRKNEFLQNSLQEWAEQFYRTEERLRGMEQTLQDAQKALSELCKDIAESQISQSSLNSLSGSLRQTSLSIERGVQEEVNKAREMKALMADFNESCKRFADLEPTEQFIVPDHRSQQL